MSGPSQIRIKRKRDEPGPETLVVEGQRQKRANTNNALYVRSTVPREDRRREEDEAVHRAAQPRRREEPSVGSNGLHSKADGQGRRTFHLSRSGTESALRERAGGNAFATFVERSAADSLTVSDEDRSTTNHVPAQAGDAERFKRPGRGAAVTSTNQARPVNEAIASRNAKRLEAVSNELHQFALEELSRETKPKPVATPRLAGARSRELHRQRTTLHHPRAPDGDVVMEDDDAGYVYDTYVLAPTAGDARLERMGDLGGDKVGYLVIAEDDQSIWETFVEGEAGDEERETDEEDENAEDYYGADYPEDELASDDEEGRNAYGFRARGASDDEEWDADTGMYSDEEEEDRMRNPWKTAKTPKQLAQYLEREED